MRPQIFIWLLVAWPTLAGSSESTAASAESAKLDTSSSSNGEATRDLVKLTDADDEQDDDDYVLLADSQAETLSDGDEPSVAATSISLPKSAAKPKRGLTATALGLTCPSRPADSAKLAVNSGTGARMILHKANSDTEPTISESWPERWHESDVDWLVHNGFDLAKPTLIYMGGWKMPHTARLMRTARRNLDRMASGREGEAPFNLLIFDWYSYGHNNYGKSVSMVPHLGKLLAAFLRQLNQRHDYQMKQVHLVSYSLSAHIAGIAGRILMMTGRGQLGQITALDPTGVCFHTNGQTLFDREYSLRPSDAKLVLARHYSMGHLGAHRLIGGVDVFINGGHQQPSMIHKDYPATRRSLRTLFSSMMVSASSHRRAVVHEVSPFERSGCQEVAYECSSQDKFEQGQCASCGAQGKGCLLISTLGNVELGRRPSEMNYELGTQMHSSTGLAQFCTFNYQVLVELVSRAPPKVAKELERGQLRFSIADLQLQPQFRMELPNNRAAFTQLLKLDSPIGEYPQQLRVPSDGLRQSIKSISINYMSNISARERERNSIRYCPAEGSLFNVCK